MNFPEIRQQKGLEEKSVFISVIPSSVYAGISVWTSKKAYFHSNALCKLDELRFCFDVN